MDEQLANISEDEYYSEEEKKEKEKTEKDVKEVKEVKEKVEKPPVTKSEGDPDVPDNDSDNDDPTGMIATLIKYCRPHLLTSVSKTDEIYF